MLLLDPTTLPWTFTLYASPPKSQAKVIEYYGCFILCNSTIARLKVPAYCRTHWTIEVIERHFSLFAWLSSTRPTQEQWLQDITKSKTRSHLCHLTNCKNPFYSVEEGQKENVDRKKCNTTACRALKDATPQLAAAFARSECSYTPKCWPTSSLPGVTPKRVAIQVRTRFQEAMKTAGICSMRSLDFPVHLGWSLPGMIPLYTKDGRYDNLDFNDL